MKTKILYSLLLCLIYQSAFAQPIFEWVNSTGGISSDAGDDITIDSNNDVIVTGFFRDTVDFDPGASEINHISNGLSDLFIKKLDSDGNLIWIKTIGSDGNDRGSSVTTDNENNIYITGYFQNTVDFDPGTGINNLTSNGSFDIFILKLDSNGNLIWAKSIGGSGPDEGNAIQTDHSNNIYVSGYFVGNVDFNPNSGTSFYTSIGTRDIYTLKLNANGDFEWVSVVNGETGADGYGICLEIDHNNDVITAGHFDAASADFNPGPDVHIESSNGGMDGFIQKLDENGNFIWSTSFGGSGADYIRSISCDQNNNVLITGSFSATVDFDPGVGNSTQSSVGDKDAYVLKLDVNGDFIWVKTFGSSLEDSGISICTDGVDNILTVGSFSSSIDLDPGMGVSSFLSQGNHDIFIQKLTSNGEFLWSQTYGGSELDYAASSVLSSLGEFYTVGRYSNTVDFDPGVNTSNRTSNGSRDIFVQKLKICTPTSSLQSHTACSSYFWNGTTYSATGEYSYVTTNAAGCDSTATLNLTIEDIAVPIADTPTLPDVTAECVVTSLTAPTATDNCAGSLTGTHNVTLPITTQGTTTVTWTYNDGNGNTSMQTQNIIISGPNVNITQVDGVTLSADLTGVDYQWIDCDNNDQPINGEVNQTFVATSNGSYAVIVDNGTCSDTSICILISTVGIDENKRDELVDIYPNPTNGQFTLELGSAHDQISIQIVNALGQLVKEENFKFTDSMKLNIETEPGIYFLEGKTNEEHLFRITIIKK